MGVWGILKLRTPNVSSRLPLSQHIIPLYDRSLKLMAILMKGDNTTACLELAEGLHTVAALEGAIKLATHFRSVGGLG